MASVSREVMRDALAQLLTTELTGSGKPVQAVYNYRIADFAGQSPVVVVTSGPVERVRQGMGACWRSIAAIDIHVFVAYAAAGGWTEANAEDAMDTIEALIADVVLNNNSTMNWHGLTYDGPTLPDAIEVGGEEYRHELIRLRAEVIGDD